MAIESIGGVTQTTSDVLRNAGLGQEDFLKILLTQLSFQDPLKPMDNQEFIAQMAQFSGLELERQSNDNVETLLAFQSVNQAVSLIGKVVDVNMSTGVVVTGEVTTVTFANGTPLIAVKPSNANDPTIPGGGATIPNISLAQISLVRDPDATGSLSGNPSLPTTPNPTNPGPTIPTVPNPNPTVPTVPNPTPPIPTVPDPFNP